MNHQGNSSGGNAGGTGITDSSKPNGANQVYKSHMLKLRNQQMNILKDYYNHYEKDMQRQAEKESLRLDKAPPPPSTTSSSEVRMNIKHFSRVLASILDQNPAFIEEELRQMTLRKPITYDEFRQFQREFMDGLYSNPSHPLDMHVSQLNEIRKDFEEAALRAKDSFSNTNGIPIDGFSQILARKMNMDPSRIQKFFQRSAFFSSITWNEFQAMLDKESTIREELLDWFMHKENAGDISSQNEYSLEAKCEECLKPKERTSQRNFVIEAMLQMKISRSPYFLVIFDEATLALYEAETFRSALEFTIPQEIALANLDDKPDSLLQSLSTSALAKENSSKNHRNTEDTTQSTQQALPSQTTITQSSSFSSPSKRPSTGVSRARAQTAKRISGNLIDRSSSSANNPMYPNSSSQNTKTSPKRTSSKASIDKNTSMNFAQMSNTYAHGFNPSNSFCQSQSNNISNTYATTIAIEPGDRRRQRQRATSAVKRENYPFDSGIAASHNKTIEISTGKQQQQLQRSSIDSSILMSMGNRGRRASRMREEGTSSSSGGGTTGAAQEEQKQQQPSLEHSYMVSTNFQTTNRTEFKRANSGTLDLGESVEFSKTPRNQRYSTISGAKQQGGGGINSQSQSYHPMQSTSYQQYANTTSTSYQKSFEQNALLARSQVLGVPFSSQQRNQALQLNEKSALRRDTLVKMNGIADDGTYKMEEDPDFAKIMKIYLTSEIRDDDDKKKIQVSFEVFYQMYKREPYRFPYTGGATPIPAENQSGIISKEKEDYISKDAETKESVRRLWKKFLQLPKDFSIAYAKAVNQIIADKNLKNVNQENLRNLFKKSVHISTAAVSQTAVPKNARSSSLAFTSKTQNPIRKKLDANWKSKICKKQLQCNQSISEQINQTQYYPEIQNIDQHININPWTCELRKSPDQKMPIFLRDIQAGIERRIDAAKERALKIKNGIKRQSHNQSSSNSNQNDDTHDAEAEAREEILMTEGDANKAALPQVKNRRNNRLKVFSVEYLEELNILALGMINRQLQLYNAYHEKNAVQVRKMYSYQFNEVIVGIAFRLNVVTKKWNIALLFENDVLRIYEFVTNDRDGKLAAFDHFYTYDFAVQIDRIQHFPEFGFVITSSKGYFFVFQDHLTSSNSSDEVKSIPQYYIDQEKRLQENGIALSITAIACCEIHKLIIFGTSKGRISFYEVKTREFLGVKDAGGDAILSLHIYQKQNQLISICRNQLISVWDIARRTQVYSFRAIEDRYDEGNGKITASIFIHDLEQLMLASNNLKVWEMKINKQLLFKERKMQQLYEWRNKDMEKQENYLRIEGEKIKYMHKNHNQMHQNWVTPEPSAPISTTTTTAMTSAVATGTTTTASANSQANLVVMRQIIRSKEVIVTWDSNSEMRILSKKTLKTKYSFMLSAPEDDKIEYLDILDNKILAMCTEKGDVYLKNLYTEDQCQKITEYEGYPLKLTQLLFLPADCQMSIAASSHEGKVLFLNSYLKKKTSKKYIIIAAHKKRIITMVSNNNNTMLSAAEDNFLTIFSLRSCSSIYRIDLSSICMRQFVQQICFSNDKSRDKDKNFAFIVLEQGQVFEVNCNDGNLVSQLRQQMGKYSKVEIDSQGKLLLSIDEDLRITLYSKNTPASSLSLLKQFTINLSQSPAKGGRSGMIENDGWTPLKNIHLNLRADPLFKKFKDNEIECKKVLYDEESSQFYIFINQKAVCIINTKTKTKRYFIYATSELQNEESIQPAQEEPAPSKGPKALLNKPRAQ